MGESDVVDRHDGQSADGHRPRGRVGRGRQRGDAGANRGLRRVLLEEMRGQSVTGYFISEYSFDNADHDAGTPAPSTDGGLRSVRLIE